MPRDPFSMQRAASLWTALVCGINLCSGCGLARETASRIYGTAVVMNPTPNDRLQVAPPIETVCVRGTIAYVISTGTGVVVVDPGYDETGEVLGRALAGRNVHAVLLTHGHIDHALGAAALGTTTYVGRGDDAALRDEGWFRAAVVALGQHTLGAGSTPDRLEAVDDGFVLDVEGHRFVSHSTPGHTPGSIVWQYETTLFGGDALTSPDGKTVRPAPFYVSDDIAQAWRSLIRLTTLRDVTTLLDGHFGRTDFLDRKLRAAESTVRRDGIYDYPHGSAPRGCETVVVN